ncbi:hypothetical protein LOZ53_001780 [Ophidiomyces ophidiicola]|nr:hypothetical protein LOZ55_001458 [Ophidiomyces ophidiicola]KAI1987901.1 hypothetical protein LOZ51_005665 [Ophidiomyces ophidiicola]KAI1994653.1 hypothetical protein LOZ53_001780 [Ophidiomyces ophidiicola]KAI1996346.1 hypothetical protein LOZ54_000219 [Ophidiomyces ophidiicola]
MMSGGNGHSDGGHSTLSLLPAAKFGATSGAAGLLYGATSSVIKAHRHPAIHAISHGIHWFAFGTSFWWMRSNILNSQFAEKPTPRERIYASAVAGGLSGGAVTWSIYRRFLPGLVVFSIVGAVGQMSLNVADDWHSQRANTPQRPLLERLAESKWMPIKTLTDEKYKDMLNEKLLGVEVEIALIDERIDELRASQLSKTQER